MAKRRLGARHWLAQRLTAVALAPLGFWFVIALSGQAGGGHAAIADWISQPLTALALLALLVVGLWHALQGIEVVLVDYLHDAVLRGRLILAAQLVGFALGAIGAYSIGVLALGYA